MKLIQANGCVMWSLVFLSSAKVNCLLYSLELFGLELNLHFSALHFMFRNYWLPFLLQEFWKCSVSAIPFFMIYFLVSFKEVVWIFAKDFFYALDSLFERSPVCLHCFCFSNISLFLHAFALYNLKETIGDCRMIGEVTCHNLNAFLQ